MKKEGEEKWYEFLPDVTVEIGAVRCLSLLRGLGLFTETRLSVPVQMGSFFRPFRAWVERRLAEKVFFWLCFFPTSFSVAF